MDLEQRWVSHEEKGVVHELPLLAEEFGGQFSLKVWPLVDNTLQQTSSYSLVLWQHKLELMGYR